MLFVPCMFLQSVYHATYTLRDTPFMTYIIYVSPPRCHYQGVIITAVYKPTSQPRLCFSVFLKSRNAKIHEVDNHKLHND